MSLKSKSVQVFFVLSLFVFSAPASAEALKLSGVLTFARSILESGGTTTILPTELPKPIQIEMIQAPGTDHPSGSLWLEREESGLLMKALIVAHQRPKALTVFILVSSMRNGDSSTYQSTNAYINSRIPGEMNQVGLQGKWAQTAVENEKLSPLLIIGGPSWGGSSWEGLSGSSISPAEQSALMESYISKF